MEYYYSEGWDLREERAEAREENMAEFEQLVVGLILLFHVTYGDFFQIRF